MEPIIVGEWFPAVIVLVTEWGHKHDHRREEFLYAIKPSDQQIYDCVLPHDSKLLDVLNAVDWDAFVPILNSYFCRNRGAPSYSLLRLLKLEFLKYFYRLGDRGVVERAKTDLLFRYFLGLSVTASYPTIPH